MERFFRYLSTEIDIEFKTGLYFLCHIYFYSVYKILCGSWEINIIILLEMLFTAYLMGYVQVFLLKNFDEAKHLGIKGLAAALLCSAIYTAISYLLKWYDRNLTATVSFFAYLMFCYVCVFWVYKLKRDVDTKLLNKELKEYKNVRKKDKEDL